MKKLVDAVRAHATENYEEGGWDYVVECYSDDEIAELIDANMTEAEAIKAVGEIVGILNERREDVQGWAF